MHLFLITQLNPFLWSVLSLKTLVKPTNWILSVSLQLYFVILDDLLVITFVALLKFQALRNVRITLDASKIQFYT